MLHRIIFVNSLEDCKWNSLYTDLSNLMTDIILWAAKEICKKLVVCLNKTHWVHGQNSPTIKKIAEPHCMSDAARENLYVNVKASNWVSGHLSFPGSLDNNHPISLCFHKTVDSWLHFLSVNAYITCCIG